MLPLPTIRFVVDFESVVQSIAPPATIVARIYTDATDMKGFPYFWSVELGRKAMVAPTVAGKKALVWTGSPGTIARFPQERNSNSVFSMSSKSTAPQEIRKKTIQQALSIAAGWEPSYNATRASMVALVNRVAILCTWLLAQNTPKRTRALSKSYRVTPAE